MPSRTGEAQQVETEQMKNYHNIETRKSPTKNAYVGYGGGNVWLIYKTTWKGWVASNQTTGATLKGRVLADISRKLSAI